MAERVLDTRCGKCRSGMRVTIGAQETGPFYCETCLTEGDKPRRLAWVEDPLREVKVVEVIEVTYTAGHGDEASPVRTVTEWHAFDGRLLGRFDPNEVT